MLQKNRTQKFSRINNRTLLNFDGISDYIDLGVHSPLDYSGSFSISFYIRPDNVHPNAVASAVFTKRRPVGSSGINIVYTAATNQLSFTIDTNNGVIQPTNALVVGEEISHCVCVWDQTNQVVSLYLNGILNSSATAPAGTTLDNDGSEQTRIGFTNGSGEANNFFAGSLQNVMIFSRAITGEEVDLIWQNGGYSPTSTHSGIISHWPLTEPLFYKATSGFIVKNTSFLVGDNVAMDTSEQYNYAKATAITANHGKMIGFVDGEIGIGNPSLIQSLKGFYNRENTFPYMVKTQPGLLRITEATGVDYSVVDDTKDFTLVWIGSIPLGVASSIPLVNLDRNGNAADTNLLCIFYSSSGGLGVKMGTANNYSMFVHSGIDLINNKLIRIELRKRLDETRLLIFNQISGEKIADAFMINYSSITIDWVARISEEIQVNRSLLSTIEAFVQRSYFEYRDTSNNLLRLFDWVCSQEGEPLVTDITGNTSPGIEVLSPSTIEDVNRQGWAGADSLITPMINATQLVENEFYFELQNFSMPAGSNEKGYTIILTAVYDQDDFGLGQSVGFGNRGQQGDFILWHSVPAPFGFSDGTTAVGGLTRTTNLAGEAGSIITFMPGSPGGEPRVTLSQQTKLNKVCEIAITIDDSLKFVTIYFDGMLKLKQSISSFNNQFFEAIGTLRINRSSYGKRYGFKKLIRTAIYNEVFSQEQVINSYNNGLLSDVRTESEVMIHHYDNYREDGTNVILDDLTGNGYNFNVIGLTGATTADQLTNLQANILEIKSLF